MVVEIDRMVYRESVNHAGWEVQEFAGSELGWINAMKYIDGEPVVYVERSSAVEVLDDLQSIGGPKEFRVYESLTYEVKK